MPPSCVTRLSSFGENKKLYAIFYDTPSALLPKVGNKPSSLKEEAKEGIGAVYDV